MQTAEVFTTAPLFPDKLRDVVLSCAKATLDALVLRGHLRDPERQQIEEVHRQCLEQGKESEIFETITRLSTIGPREIPDFIGGLGLAVGKTMKERVTLIPGLVRCPIPSIFYDNYPEHYDLARILLAPVIYSEDNEVLGIGSVNPIPAVTLARIITRTIEDRTGVRPFVTAVRMDYDAWRTLLGKHFGL